MRKSYIFSAVVLSLPLLALAVLHAMNTPDDGGHSLHGSTTIRTTPTANATRNAAVQISAASYPIAIDGSKSPDQVPDRIAYYHFVIATIPLNASEQQIAKRERTLRSVGLSDADRAALIAALSDIGHQLSQNERDMKALTRDTAIDPTQVSPREQRKAILENARAKLSTALSPQGQALVQAYVQQMKKSIVIYGVAPEQ